MAAGLLATGRKKSVFNQGSGGAPAGWPAGFDRVTLLESAIAVIDGLLAHRLRPALGRRGGRHFRAAQCAHRAPRHARDVRGHSGRKNGACAPAREEGAPAACVRRAPVPRMARAVASAQGLAWRAESPVKRATRPACCEGEARSRSSAAAMRPVTPLSDRSDKTSFSEEIGVFEGGTPRQGRAPRCREGGTTVRPVRCGRHDGAPGAVRAARRCARCAHAHRL